MTQNPGSSSSPPPPGWYPDPDGQGQRYWDGANWTEHRAAQAPAGDQPGGPQAGGFGAQPGAGQPGGLGQPGGFGAQPATPPEKTPAFWAIIGSIVLMIIGSFGPWAKALDIVTVNGTEGDGWVVIFFAVVGGALAFAWSRNGKRGFLIGIIVAGALSSLATLIDLNSLSEEVEGFGDADVVDAQWGIYLALIGSLAMTAAAVATMVTQRKPAA